MITQGDNYERETHRFFRSLYGDEAPGYLALWTRQDRLTQWILAKELDRAARVTARLAESKDVYFGVGLRAHDLGPHHRGEGNEVIGIPGLWADVDVRGAAHKALDLPPSKDAALGLLSKFSLPPTLVVDTGHGLQLWWIFERPWIFRDEEERRKAQNLVSRFQATLQATAKARDWRIDTTSDLARVMRAPGTFNRKLEPVPVRVVEMHEDRKYDPSDFAPHLVGEVPVLSAEQVGDRIPEGRRNDTLTSMAGSMRYRAFDEEAIYAAIWKENLAKCVPPLDKREVRRIVKSIARYEPGTSVKDDRFVAGLPSEPENLSAAPNEEAAAESKMRFYTAKDLAERTPGEVRWIAKPYLAEGAVTELVGKIKASGKTTWTTHMCARVLDGEDFMGEPTEKTGVLYLSEQAQTSFREALRRAKLLDREDLSILLWRDTIGVGWPAVVHAAVEEALRREAGLLVVDTLPQFAGLQGDAENSASAALAAIQPLQEAAAVHGLAVLVVRHERKSGGQVADSGRGSSAFAGGVDVVIALRRSEGNARPTIRVLHALSRFDETPDTLVVELTEDGYRALGSEAAVAEEEAHQAILESAPTAEAEAVDLGNLLEAAGVKRTVAQKAIEALRKAGRLHRTGGGVKGNPYRYWRPDDPSEPDEQHDPPTDGDDTTPPTQPADEAEGGDDAGRSPEELADPASGAHPKAPPEEDWYMAVQRHFEDKEPPNNVDPSCPAVANVLWRCTNLIKE